MSEIYVKRRSFSHLNGRIDISILISENESALGQKNINVQSS